MNLFFRNQGFVEGYTPIANPGNSPLQRIEFGRLQLRSGHNYSGQSGSNEVVLDILAGTCEVTITFDGTTTTYTNLGGRADVFSGRPTLICLPPGAYYTITANSAQPLDIAVSAGPCPPGGQPAVIGPNDNITRTVGVANWERQVHLGTVGTGVTHRLMVGETINKPGCWSSYPPHKHDTNQPGREIAMEEVYFYLIKPKQGFGVQCLYDPPHVAERLETAFLVRDGDTVVLPRGYHPAVAAPGYQLCYLWALYSEEGIYGSEAWSDDPDHAWVRNVEAMLK